jgi:UDP-xylose/UDP-N-acetylglucosamine transporter B4
MKKKGTNRIFTLIFLREWLFIILLIIGGCCTNVLSLEVLTNNQPRSATLITFFQFLTITLIELPRQLKLDGFSVRFRKLEIPFKYWIILVFLYGFVSILNNYALEFNVPIPLHILFRSGNLAASMLMGIVFFQAKYSRSKILSVIILSLGIFLSTYYSSNSYDTKVEDIHKFLFGILILTFALFFSCVLGNFQEYLYKVYGKHWHEALFYSHALFLPVFILFYKSLRTQIYEYNKSSLVSLGEAVSRMFNSPIDIFLADIFSKIGMNDIKVPVMWIYLLLNALTQCSCLFKIRYLRLWRVAINYNSL